MKVKSTILEKIKELKVKLKEAFDKSGGRKWSGVVDNIWAFGKKRNGPNLLVNKIENYARPSIWSIVDDKEKAATKYRDFDNSIVSGFMLACNRGPLCEEPLYGVCFIIEKWDFEENTNIDDERLVNGYG